MTCIRCNQASADQPSHVDAGEPARRCAQCGAEVAFEPQDGDLVDDDTFARILHRTSSGNSVRFCKQQLFYELWRSIGRKPTDFDAMFDRWCSVHGTPEGLVQPWPPRWDADAREADIGDYSFDRVIITDHAWVVDFLLANNFHFETSSAILSIDGYPHDRFATIREMLGRNPRIVVIALHDATDEGCQVPHRLVREDGWFREHGHVVDIGLLPEHRFLYKSYCEPRAEPAEQRGKGSDAKWLANNTLELAVVRPEKLMRRLFRATRIYANLWTQPVAYGELHSDPDLLAPKHTGRGW